MEGHRYDDSKTVSKRSSGKIILSQNKLYVNYTGSSQKSIDCSEKHHTSLCERKGPVCSRP